MNPFLKDHLGPLVGSAGLHVIVAAAAIVAAWWTVAPKITPSVAIEAYIAARPSPRPAAAPPPTPAAPAPEPSPEPAQVAPPPAPVVDPQAAERAEARREHEAAVRSADAKREANARREADALRERKAAEVEDAKRRAAQQETQRRAQEAKRKADAVADAKRRADAAQFAARESDLAKRLAQEEHREGVAHSGLLEQYITEIQARIERAWNRPPSARPGLSCTLLVSQVPGGTVTNVRLGECNGDAAVQQSITQAVYKASPLPTPPDPSLFDRNLRLVFAPQ